MKRNWEETEIHMAKKYDNPIMGYRSKSLFVFEREEHMEAESHEKVSIKTAIRKLKAKRQADLLTLEDLNYVDYMFDYYNK